MAKANFENTGSRYQQFAKDFATDNKATVSRLKPIVKDYDGTTKVYFEVVFKEGTTRWPFSFFCKHLPTPEDLEKLKTAKIEDVLLQWGRKGHTDDDGKFVPEEGWGKPKVMFILLEGGEEFEFQGGVDEYQGDETETI